MVGIALAGWDRIGWSRALHWRDHWMRMRDRRAPLAMAVLVAAYIALAGWGASAAVHLATGTPTPHPTPALAALLALNAVLLLWRLACRALFTGLAYGPVEALWAVPRTVVGNYVALLAARRAMTRYVAMLHGAAPRWDKTAHVFPDQAVAKER